MKAMAMAILVAELLWEPVLAVLMSMLVLVILEPLVFNARIDENK